MSFYNFELGRNGADVLSRRTGSLAVLVSHVAEYTAPNALSYAIVLLDVGTTQNSVTVAGLRHLAYQAVSPSPSRHATLLTSSSLAS